MSSKKIEDDLSQHKKPSMEESNSWHPNHPIPIFASCSTRSDENTGYLIRASSSEIFECCVGKCKPKHDYCVGACKKYLDDSRNRFTNKEKMGRCIANCRIMDTLCTQECRGLAPGFNIDNSYYDCAVKNGCPRGLGQIPDKNCVKKNKDIILNCCRSRCTPTNVIDCQEHCETLEQTIVDPQSLGMFDNMYPYTRALDNQPLQNIQTEKGEKKALGSIYSYIGVAVGASSIIALCLITSLYMYHKKRK
jgi:hypothetical protein